MRWKVTAGALPVLLFLALAGLMSCQSMDTSKKPVDGPMPDLTPTQINYVDGDGFDAVFESALVNQDPIVVVRTGRPKPDWEGRLNAWIAAWNRSDRARKPVARGQSPLTRVPFDGESIREFRQLVGDLLDRAEDLAGRSSAWWAEERMRARRVGLLRPYSLRFHMDEEGLIQLVFFHGNYASYYPRFLQKLMRTKDPMDQEWTRTVECSRCPGAEKQGRAS